ncbi:TonB-dependent receptor plug domain-containing protein [Parasphingorhabdus litoris]|uniref:TonB-dependent receptor plug domain-containing protein n=1 Tax=Parasphingorhabdus litoris TaxID=394733 RepID=A0ABP3K7R1_9SPHN|nr:TonB-dependent receptor [Parasphingorhabdus litoris]
MTQSSPRYFGASILALSILNALPAYAQSNDDDLENEEIVVTAERLRGSVITEVPPIVELDADDIASYGVSSVEDLVGELSSQTTSNRGRGSGRPIVLINGQRTSGFRDIRDLPPEAIKSVQVFPEELALQYGYAPDERVINFILQDDYTGLGAEVEYGVPTRGDMGKTELESTFTRIGENSRLNLDIEYETQTAITEAERGIIQDSAGDLVNLGRFRTLSAPTDTVEFNGNYSRTFANGMSLSLNGGYVYDKSRALLGLPSGTLDLPVTGDSLFRYFTQFGPLRKTVETNTFQGGAVLNGMLSGWRWSLTADYARVETETETDNSGDISALQAAIDAGTVDPFAANFGALLSPPITDEARSVSNTLESLATISGGLLNLPSGSVTTTLRGGYRRQDLDSRDTTDGLTTLSSLGRDNFNAGINIDIPLADENIDVAETIGQLSINGNLGYSELSDFGGLVEFGFGLNWEPLDGLVFTASAIGEEAAPTIQQLGNPVIVTPNVTTFDFTNGETVLASITTGGNLNLPAEKRRDIKLAVNYSPEWLDGMMFLGEYIRNNSENVASDFPILTEEIEAAFPDRVTRDETGRLVAIDQRPVNYSNVRSESIRYGLEFSKRFGQRRGARGPRGAGGRPGGGGGGPPGDRPPPESGAGTEQSEAGRPDAERSSDRAGRPPRSSRGPGRRGGGRWRVSAYHTVHIDERVLIRPGVEELDLLNGSAIGSTGGQPRHEFELQGRWFNNGIGFRLQAEHQTATRVDGGLTSSDLRFSDLTTLNLRMFINLDDRGTLTERFKFLKGSRIAFRIDNVFNDIQDVRDSDGLVPLRYQPGFIDPIGRYVEVSFRKRF